MNAHPWYPVRSTPGTVYQSFGSIEAVDGLASERRDERSGYYGDLTAGPADLEAFAGLGRFGSDASAPQQVCQSLAVAGASRILWALAGYYVARKVGGTGGSAGLVGAAATALAGPVGLAATVAYYARSAK